MGQKVHPKGFRLGVIESWDSKWFARRDYAQLLHEDLRIRKFLKERLYHAGVSKVEIERAANKAKINIYTARPGIASRSSTFMRCVGPTSMRSWWRRTSPCNSSVALPSVAL
jgi:ribosomal protein S3